MNDPDFFDLIAAWYENTELPPERRQQLLDRLADDVELRRELAREIQTVGLTEAVQAGEPRWLRLEEMLEADGATDLSLETEEKVMASIADHPGFAPNRRVPAPRGWLIAGSVAAMAIFGLFLWTGPMKETDPGIARIIRIEGGGAEVSGRGLSAGDELRAGEQLSMESGMIEMAFRETGVHIIATAPLSLTADSPNRISLHDGEAKLHVPPQGVGFVVETAERKITDLGTSFVVTAREQGSKVLVLDGEIMVEERDDEGGQLMVEGDLANFDLGGTMKFRSGQRSGVPELIKPSLIPTEHSLSGNSFGFDEGTVFVERIRDEDFIGKEFLPLIRSEFKDRSGLERMKQGPLLRFGGIAGSYDHFPERSGLDAYSDRGGWLAWYQGRVTPPQSGRFRFWGYADNQLLVAINGEPLFEASRYNSVFRSELNVPRQNHPGWPCLNAKSGFASGPWIDIGDESVQIDILYGETGGKLTSGLLLIEREGASYDETFWGQPKWSLFLTEPLTDSQITELENLREHMEEKLMGSFSISEEAIWKVSN
ncbi:MAG: hypothetical protein ACI9R3_001344 [Verrucomicrobiales bacterium]|jgi:hypothetical protein